MKDTTIYVIDTIRAKEIYNNNVEPKLLNKLNKLKDEYSICENLIQSKKKKVSSDIELQILRDAHKYVLSENPELRPNKLDGPGYWRLPFKERWRLEEIESAKKRIRKDVEKGKLTDDVKSYLSIFEKHLGRKIESMETSMTQNWLVYVDNPPTKLMTTQVENYYYRGAHYNDKDFLDKIDRSAMTEGVEFLFSGKGSYEKESYPTNISYLQFTEIPDLRVTYDNDNNKIREVYDNKGNLVLVPYLDRNAEDIFKEFKRIVYFNDYRNNKYKIKSEKQSTQKCINLWLGRKNGLKLSQSEFDAMERIFLFNTFFGSQKSSNTNSKLLDKAAVYGDAKGKNFIAQLEKDHTNEFGYIYSIDRVSDKQFRVVYLNKETLKPSICGIVTFETGTAPYKSTYSVRLCDLPQDIPPVIKH